MNDNLTDDEQVTVRVLTKTEAQAELARLINESGMTREELERRGRDFDLDARERTLLADIEGLEWMIGL